MNTTWCLEKGKSLPTYTKNHNSIVSGYYDDKAEKLALGTDFCFYGLGLMDAVVQKCRMKEKKNWLIDSN